MIRHKRVHTNERPFRCKYCSRTSKWKADLVRHVAKTHGIRVVSKYSRSKTFHNSTSTSNMTNSINESNGKKRNCVEILTDLKNDKGISLRCKKPKTLRLPIMYRCVICLFEEDSVLVLMSHLKSAHNALPYECHSCGSSFMDAHTTMKHFIEKTTCKRTDLKINIAPPNIIKNNFNLKPSLALLDEAAKRAAQELFGKSSVITSSVISTRNATLPATLVNKYEMKQANTHDNNQNEIIYNCIFCNWTAKKMCAMEEHVRMHTITNPSLLMQPINEIIANSTETQKKVNSDSTLTTEQVLATSRYFDFRTILSLLKQQATFNPMLSIRALTSTPTLLSEWASSGPSAFKQVCPIPEEITRVSDFTCYPGIHGTQQRKTIQQLNFLFSDTNDNISCNSVAVISNFNSGSRFENFCHVNSTSSNVPEKSSINSNLPNISSSSSNYHISEGVIKAIQHYCQRRSALFSPVPVMENKIQRLVDLPESSENKTGQKNEPEEAHDLNIMRKEEDDFVDVVQLDS
ncbi:Zinc-finger double domain family protein [Acanthocheilonema viteae]